MDQVESAAPRQPGRVARLYLGVLLGAMAVGQAASFGVFVDSLETYRAGSGGTTAVLLLAGEIVAAAGLLVPRAHRLPPSVIGLAVALAWSALAAQAFARGLVVPNCGCFGAYLGQELRWWVLLEDVAFVALAASVVRTAARARQLVGQSL